MPITPLHFGLMAPLKHFGVGHVIHRAAVALGPGTPLGDRSLQFFVPEERKRPYSAAV